MPNKEEEKKETEVTSGKEKPISEQKSAPGNESMFSIQRIYIKDLSFEEPNSPSIFQSDWKPEVNLNLNTEVQQLSDEAHEVVLKITATVKNGDKTAFLIEIKQAGIFVLKAFPKDQLHYMLSSFCPNILFPYAREVISEMVVRGGFPPLYLSPINFDALYQQQMAKQQQGTGTGTETKK